MTASAQARAPSTERLKLVFEDADVVVIDKPPGVAVHEAKGILKRHTVLGMLEKKYRAEGVAPRLVHRLDRDTSGLLVVAKTPTAARTLEQAFANSLVEKEYTCLVAGRLDRNRGV
ncbi:MAG TPA: pseudouridine synthase, partial [Candidatus Eisenbacteria bacterium]|nr:pseudouridine synthase [Candidatus Eisenbacteria bacterium]